MPARTVVLAMLPPARGGPRPARASGQRPRTRIMDSDFKLGFKFRVTVTVTARFKFLRVSRDGHAGTSLRIRGLVTRLAGGSRMDSGTEPRAVLVAQPGGGSPDGTGNRTSVTRAGRRLK